LQAAALQLFVPVQDNITLFSNYSQRAELSKLAQVVRASGAETHGIFIEADLPCNSQSWWAATHRKASRAPSMGLALMKTRRKPQLQLCLRIQLASQRGTNFLSSYPLHRNSQLCAELVEITISPTGDICTMEIGPISALFRGSGPTIRVFTFPEMRVLSC
jgi:hypothetical protein